MTKNVTKEAKKIAKKALEITAEESKRPYTIETTFSLGGATPLALKQEAGSMIWIFKLNVNQILDRSFYKYNIRLSINAEPFERRIEDAQRKINEIASESHLPGMGNNAEIKNLEQRIKDIEAELDKLIRETDVIDIYATVRTLEYKGVKTSVEFEIPADTIALLNKNRYYFSQYKIELQPIFDRLTQSNEQ